MAKKLKKIISGGQTGADRAGLEAAVSLNLQTGGWAPKGWRIDGGSDPSLKEFGLIEHPDDRYPPRTRMNVLDSDGTLLFGDMKSPGCRLTIQFCTGNNKPYLCNPTVEEIRKFVEVHRIQVLNIAGNRERTNPGIGEKVKTILTEAFQGSGSSTDRVEVS